ncbi:DNA-binding GntR family transcriptional regulator [Scopulibacillus darangshiensis]|uniref:DNA-binding GntR family transcriptional regulator n=1 Tax=Scopulibacillus darangshiensis TaxID=442528 RepID=A0A4R2NKC2_9BACL|nr:GntR family transcriptional regulator [Scopulibacillus darangshiensis]TCP21715.1 DNA-binding GntR family transcriptional regulator [Scopulibacillus darangshiensis]
MNFLKAEQPQLFKDHAYKEIKQGIIQHKIEPGSMLYERSLSESLGISRTPLKLALQQLELEGWIQSVPRKGILVKNINRHDVDEVFQLRKANEVLVIELLIPLLDDETFYKIEKMDKQLFDLKEDPLKFIYHDSSFHLFLAELSQNHRLYQLIQNLTDHFNWYGFAALKAGKSIDEIYYEHNLIIEGLKARNLHQTTDAVLSHIDNTYKTLIVDL